MQWIILFCGLIMLFLLTRKKRVSIPLSRHEPSDGRSLSERMTAAAQQANGHGYVRVRSSSGLLIGLERSISYLNRFSTNELLPSARQLCQNGRYLQEEAASVIKACHGLPKLPRALTKETRIWLFAQELFRHQAADITSEVIFSALDTWQNQSPLTFDELNALPILLRMGLTSEILSLSQQCQHDQQARQSANQAHLLHKHGKTRAAQKLIKAYAENSAFWEGLLRLEEPNEWMGFEHSFWQNDPEALVAKEHERQAEYCQRISNAIASLHTISHMPWHRIAEEKSTIHQALKQDPVYLQMDEESRACYRSRVGRIARSCRFSEQVVCAVLLGLCQNAPKQTLEAHTGFYLLDDGYPFLLKQLHAFGPIKRLKQMFHTHACLLFRFISWTAFLLILGIGFANGYTIAILIPFAFVFLYAFQQIAIRLIQPRLNPHMVPRLDIKKLENPVLVVCPVMLMNASHALALVKHLSIMHEANPDQNLHFLLLGDFQDSLTATLSSDVEIISTASMAIHALCEDTGHPFFYLQRERSYSPGEGTHHGRERRRGSLETLLCAIQGHPIHDSFAFSSIELSALRGKYRYVITIDEDTILPPGSIHRMVGAMQHPMQKRQLHNGKMRGISILQPHMETAPHLAETHFSCMVGNVRGFASFHQPISNIANNLFDRGIYSGNGIIDPEPFLNATQGAIPEGRILMHALLEGSLAGCAYAGDIVLYRGQTQNLKSYLLRLHRLVRGDWQLSPYLLPVIGYSGREHLDIISRFQIWRNLLKSLIAPFRMLVMLYAAFTSREWLLLNTILLPEISLLFSLDTQNIKRFLIKLALLPCEAWQQTDAIARTLYRLLFSRQHLLDWEPAVQVTSNLHQPSMLFFGLNMTCAGLFAAFPLLLNGAWLSLLPAALWAAFPFVLPRLEQPRISVPRPTEYMREMLMRLTRHTFTFFETAMTESDHGLPPDNVQIEPNRGIAHRTTPTSVGMYLCSLISVQKLGILSAEEMAKRMSETVHTLEALPKWRGLMYRWYDTQTLLPLSPGFVSSAECGNLAVCLLTCAQGLRTLLPELDSVYHDLPARIDRLCHSMQFDRLYDANADLFYTGFDTEKGLPTKTHYDLLASQSRLLSFAAIMLQQVPLRHWFRLKRTQTNHGALLSYNGTMLEYIMPTLFQPLVPQTLLHKSCHQIISLQRKRRLGGAFGISESGYHAFDPMLNYQYKAFGLPEVALDADIQSNVLAPYASMLLLPLKLKKAFQNLQRLQQLGLEGPLGLFEAADFSPDRTDGKKMAIVRSHVAHHQGMILCAICNTLSEGYITHLFSSLPRAQAYQLLLEEPDKQGQIRIRHPLRRQKSETFSAAECMRRSAEALKFPIDAHLLCGGKTSLIIDAQGGGYLKHGDIMLTRFQDSCHIPSGVRLYLRDSESGAYWTATDPYLTRSIQFESAQAVFAAERFDIHSELRIWINPLDGSCIHHLTLENTTNLKRTMEVCSYLEPALCRHHETNAHSALQNLFIQTERLGKRGVTVLRRSDHANHPSCRLWHLLTTDTHLNLFRIQTDRVAFIGRGRSFHSPRAMEIPISAVADSTGDVIEPCVTLRGQFTLESKGKAVFCFMTHLASEAESAIAFCERYAKPYDIIRTYESALTRSTVTAQYFQLTEHMQEAISRLTGVMAYKGQPSAFSCTSPLPIQRLQQFGITGDVPLLLYTCFGTINETMLKLLLNAHALWHTNGFPIELIILVEESKKCAEITANAEALISHSHCQEMKNQPGGIFVLNHLSEEDKQLLYSTARFSVTSGGGSLEQQLDEHAASVRARPLYLFRSATQWQQQLPPVDKVLFSNGYGGFTPENGDYQITLAPGRQTPAPWCNPLCTKRFGTLACESGLLFTYFENSQKKQLTSSFNDMVTPLGEENFFIRDSENHLIWSVTRLPLGHNTTVRITHAPGETTYESSGYGIYARMHCFTDSEEAAGIRMIQLQNDSQTERILTFFHTCHFAAHDGRQICMECMEDRSWCFLPQAKGWAGICTPEADNVSSASMTIGLFQGLWSIVPFSLSSMEHLPQHGGDTAVLSFRICLKPGESRMLTSILAFGTTKERFSFCLDKIRSAGASERLHAVRLMWEERLGILQFDLPDKSLSFLLNRWLPYQTQSSRLWMHAGFYQTGHTGVCLDHLQDQLSKLITAPEEVREYILRCAEQSFAESDAQLSPCANADMLLLPYVTATYIEATGDKHILTEQISRPQAAVCTSNKNVLTLEAASPSVCDSMLQCCLGVIDRIAYGAHDLPLIHTVDHSTWKTVIESNDRESVWIGMFLCEVIRRLIPYCDAETAARLNQRRTSLMAALEKSAWDGNWYLYGWNNNGSRLGCQENEWCKINLLSQCLAVICGLSRERSEMAMENAWRLLYEKDIGIFRLLTPPFGIAKTSASNAGYAPGIRENGGQCTLTACLTMAALHQLGQDERAWELLGALLPTNRSATRQLAGRYRVEPYVLADDIYANLQQRGRGGWTWYTSAAAWFQTVVIQQMLGFCKNSNELRFRPVVPETWDAIRITYRYGSSTYHLHASRDCLQPTADGELLADGVLLLTDDGKIHEAHFPLRS